REIGFHELSSKVQISSVVWQNQCKSAGRKRNEFLHFPGDSFLKLTIRTIGRPTLLGWRVEGQEVFSLLDRGGFREPISYGTKRSNLTWPKSLPTTPPFEATRVASTEVH